MAKTDGLKKGNKATQFTSDRQPSPEAKKAGRIKKTLLKQIAKQIVSGTYKESLEDLAELLGVDPEAIDLETAMHLKQMEKALTKGDTYAYNALMDRLKGKPVQAIQMEDAKILPTRYTIVGTQSAEDREAEFMNKIAANNEE